MGSLATSPAGSVVAGFPPSGGENFLPKEEGDFWGGETDGVLVAVLALEAGVGSNLPAAVAANSRSEGDMPAMDTGGRPLLRAAMAADWKGDTMGPTHCLMWSTKTCMGILSQHFSQEILPVASPLSALLIWPVNSCWALSNSNSFLTGNDFFLFSLAGTPPS